MRRSRRSALGAAGRGQQQIRSLPAAAVHGVRPGVQVELDEIRRAGGAEGVRILVGHQVEQLQRVARQDRIARADGVQMLGDAAVIGVIIEIAADQEVNGAVIDRFETSAYGLGDLKLLGTVWLLDPDHNKRHNVSAGLGVLFPTGEKDAKDTFKTFGTNSAGLYEPRAVTQNVDNSIQPGSGAWGIIFDLYAFQELFENCNLFAAGTYIATPERDAGVISGNPNLANPTIWSVNDSYLGRLGLGYTFWPKYGLTFTLDGRIEGAPVHDLIGSSGGRRRPGYAVSIEPGIVFTKNRWFASFSTPVALYRNRQQSAVETSPGGDAAFADFMTLFSLGRSF